jgi:hypothetical protein
MYNTNHSLTTSIYILSDYSVRVSVNIAVNLNVIESELIMAVKALEIIRTRHYVFILPLLLKARSVECDVISVKHLKNHHSLNDVSNHVEAKFP